jgi:hypothetical protein
MNPIHTLIHYFIKIHFYIILPSASRSPFRHSGWNILCISHLPIRATCPVHQAFLNLKNTYFSNVFHDPHCHWRACTRMYLKVSELAAWSENCKWHNSLPLGTVVSQSGEFCRHNPLCCFSTNVYCYKGIFRYRLSPETFGYTLLCPLPQYQSLHPEDGGSMTVRNVGITPHHYTASEPRRPRHEPITNSSHREIGGSKAPRNLILSHHYMTSRPGRPRLESSSPRKTQIS